MIGAFVGVKCLVIFPLFNYRESFPNFSSLLIRLHPCLFWPPVPPQNPILPILTANVFNKPGLEEKLMFLVPCFIPILYCFCRSKETALERKLMERTEICTKRRIAKKQHDQNADKRHLIARLKGLLYYKLPTAHQKVAKCNPNNRWTAIARSVQRLAIILTVRRLNPGKGEIFRTRPDRPLGSLSSG